MYLWGRIPKPIAGATHVTGKNFPLGGTKPANYPFLPVSPPPSPVMLPPPPRVSTKPYSQWASATVAFMENSKVRLPELHSSSEPASPWPTAKPCTHHARTSGPHGPHGGGVLSIRSTVSGSRALVGKAQESTGFGVVRPSCFDRCALSAQVGACGYGAMTEASWPFQNFASVISNSNIDLYSGKCGACYELDCTGALSQWWDSSVCTGSNVVVQVTGQCSCPAGQPDHVCCKSQPYMVVSRKAMTTLAAPVWDGTKGTSMLSSRLMLTSASQRYASASRSEKAGYR
eukprot:1179191-Prorocentrum_minimum.AAC.2